MRILLYIATKRRDMDFGIPVRTTYKTIVPKDYFNRICPSCNSINMIIRDSRVREVPDLGSPSEKVIARLEVATFLCKECGLLFTPEHPLYPPKFEYSRAILEYALTHFHYHNATGKIIVRDLATVHNVQVPEATVYSWLKRLSPAFLEAKRGVRSEQVLSTIKSITIDGVHVSTGKAIIGKKKLAD